MALARSRRQPSRATEERIGRAIKAHQDRVLRARQPALARGVAVVFLRLERYLERRLKPILVGPQLKELGDSLEDWSGLVPESFEDDVKRVVSSTFMDVAEQAGTFAGSQIGVIGSFSTNARDFRSIEVAQIGARVKGIDRDTRDRLRSIVRTGLNNGESPQTIAKHLIGSVGAWRGKDGTILHSRAMVIARTETAIAYNRGANAAYKKSGIIRKVRVLDAPTCGWIGHNSPDTANGKLVTFEEAGKAPVSHPNCVRAFAPVFAEDEEEPLVKPPESLEQEEHRLEAEGAQNADELRRLSGGADPARERALRLRQGEIGPRLTQVYQQRIGKMGLNDLRRELDALETAIREGTWGLSPADDFLRGIDYARQSFVKDRLFDVKQALPFAERVAFRGPASLRPVYDDVASWAQKAEDNLGHKFRWDGKLVQQPTTGNVAAWAQSDGSVINVGKAMTMPLHDQRKVMIHEMLHTASNASYRPGRFFNYGQWAGWEEGVVEKMAQTLERQLFPIAQRRGYAAYSEYTHHIDRIVDSVALKKFGPYRHGAVRDFSEQTYRALFKLPNDEREAYIKKLVKATPGLTVKQFQESFNFLKGANKVAKS
jgi:hypothetical protein